MPICSTDEQQAHSRPGARRSVIETPEFRAECVALEDEFVHEAEDATDAAQIREAEARVEAGGDEYVPIEVTRRLMTGEVPVRVWREYRGLSARTLAGRAGISTAYLSQIETGKKPGSFDAMAKLARALGVAMEDLASWRT